jgi:hypothetical protein
MKSSKKKKSGKVAYRYRRPYREHPPGPTDPLEAPKKKKAKRKR